MVHDAIGEAELLLEKGDWPSVVKLMQEVIGSLDGGQLTKALLLKARALSKMGRFKESAMDLKKALEMAVENKDPSLEMEALHGLGFVHKHMPDHIMAFVFYEKALEMTRSYGEEKLEATVLIDIGNLDSAAGRLGGAAQLYQEAIEILSQFGPSDELARAYQNLGDVQLKMGRTEEAMDSLKGAIDVGTPIGNITQVAWARSLLALALTRNGRTEEAREVIDEATKDLKRVDDAPGLAQALAITGVVHGDEGDVTGGIEVLDQGLEMSRKGGYIGLEAEILMERAALNVKRGEMNEAWNDYELALSNFKDLGNMTAIRQIDAAFASIKDRIDL